MTNQYFANIYKALYTVLIGMRITFKQMFRHAVTHQYPYERPFEKKRNVREIPKGYRGQLFNRIEDCIGCKKCEMICPVDCISITTQKLPKGERLWDSMNVIHLKDNTQVIGVVEGEEKVPADTTVVVNMRDNETREIASHDIARVVERKPVIFYLDKFDIDMSLCMYCGLCTEVCPTECLIMIDDMSGIEYSTFDRMDLIFPFAKPEMYDQPSTSESND